MKTHVLKLVPFIAAIEAFLVAAPVEAQGLCQDKTCCINTNAHDTERRGDQFYKDDTSTRIWIWCRDEWIDFWRSKDPGFGILSTHWQGDGLEAPCYVGGSLNSTASPALGRTFTTVLTLCYSHPQHPVNINDISGTTLRWGCGWATRSIDNLQAKCLTDATAKYQAGLTNRVEIAIPLYFYQFVDERASTLMHEAGHWNGWNHLPFLFGESIDAAYTFDPGSTWSIEVNWLVDYAVFGTDVPPGSRCHAKQRAVEILNSEFLVPPPMSIPQGYATIPVGTDCDWL